jgi:hypothetical protein
MQYMLLFHQPAAAFEAASDPARVGEYMGAWGAYIGALYASGTVVSGAGLMPPQTATTVRMRAGKRQVQDGPYADTREHLGGYFVIDVPSLDVALDWAARAPSSDNGSTEVRPVLPSITPGA